MKARPDFVVQLVHIHGPLKGQIQEFTEDTIQIGRDPSCQIRFPASMTMISRKHAEIVREGNRFKLVDHSANGTYVNGKLVENAFLKDGDVILFAEGGPKVSFLTQVKQAIPAGLEASPAAVEAPAHSGRQESLAPIPETEPPVRGMESKPLVEPPPQRAAARPEPPVEVRSVNAPLVIQYGPTLRSYKELPITLGRHPACDFVLDHPEILDRHVQIFYSQNAYWIKDLTGLGHVRINGEPARPQRMLQPEDEISLSAKGPTFIFLGDGRLAERMAPPEPPPPPEPQGPSSAEPPQQARKGSFIKKLLGH